MRHQYQLDGPDENDRRACRTSEMHCDKSLWTPPCPSINHRPARAPFSSTTAAMGTRTFAIAASLALTGCTAGSPERIGTAQQQLPLLARWQETKLDNPLPTGTAFGWSVAAVGAEAFVGYPDWSDGSSTSGAAFAFARQGSSWSMQTTPL